MRPKSIRNSMTNRSNNHVFLKQLFWAPLRNPMGSKIRSWSAEGPSRACQDSFRQSLFPYLALHPPSHLLFFMLSHWVSVSAGHPAIADARKGGFWEPRISKMGPKIDQWVPELAPKTVCFFQLFQKSRNNFKTIVFTMVFESF